MPLVRDIIGLLSLIDLQRASFIDVNAFNRMNILCWNINV